jgi:hypothetical protein
MRLRIGRQTATVLAVLYMTAFATYFANRPSYDWDMLAYMAAALRDEGVPTERIHDEVYGAIQALPKGVVDNLTGRLTPEAVAAGSATTQMADPDLRQDWAAHSDSFMAQVPFYSVKPLYPAVMALGHSFGLSLITSGLIVSAIAYFSIGLLFYLWFADWMPPIVAFGTMALLILNPWLVVLARSVGPDILSIGYLLFGAYFAMRGHPVLSAYAFLGSIVARPENIIYAGVFLLYLGVTRQLSPWRTGLFIAATGALYSAISAFGGNYGWKTLFYYVFINRNARPGNPVPHIGLADYVMAYLGRIDQIFLGQGELPVFLLIGYAALCLKAGTAMVRDKYVHLLVIAAVIAAGRMLVLPTEAFRAILPCYMLVTVAFVNACAQLRNGGRLA